MGNEFKSKKSYAHKNPKWSEKHQLKFGSMEPCGFVNIEFTSEGDHICEFVMSAKALVNQDDVVNWFDCKREGKASGKVKLQVIYDVPPAPKKEEVKV